MAHTLSALLTGPTASRTSPEYRAYQAGLLLSARIKTALWIVRDHPDNGVRTALRGIRKDLGRRNDARATALGPGCSRIEPTIGRDTLNDLRYRYRDVLVQAQILLGAAIDDLASEDSVAQSAALATLAGEAR